MRNLRTFTLLLPVVATTVLCLPAPSTGSAIPMWEFLSRDEKMSHLFRVFSKQVTRYCSDSPRPDCSKNLLVSGIRSLSNMDENLLDKLDPYQRGAKEMIWRAMVGSGRFSSRVGQGPDDSYFTTSTDLLATSGSETNGLGEETAAASDYVRPSSEHSGPYLVGPMVIRVYPDGRPVPEDSTRPLPRDEDAEDLRYVRVPSIEEIEAAAGSFYAKPTKDTTKRPAFNGNSRRRPPLAAAPAPERIRDASLPFERRLLQEISNTKRKIQFY